MVQGKVKTTEGGSEWFHTAEHPDGSSDVQSGSIQLRGVGEPCWERTVFVPTRTQPIDIVEAYPYDLPFPMFCSGIPKLSKGKVEYIASAMVDANLRVEMMCNFTVACYERVSVKQLEVSRGGLCYNSEDFIGKNVLISGNHCFLAFLLCGLSPSELQPIRINLARYRVERVYPWWMVSWGNERG